MQNLRISSFGGFAGPECDRWQQKCAKEAETDPDPRNRDACRGTAEYVCKNEAAGSVGGSGSSAITAPASSGVSAGEVLTGIGAILAPLAQVGVSIYASQQQAKLAKMQMKYQQQSGPPQPLPYFPPPPPKKSPVLFIVIALVVCGIGGMMFYMMSQGNSGGYAPGAPIASVGAVGAAGGAGIPAPSPALASPAPRIAAVRRVRRRRRRPRS